MPAIVAEKLLKGFGPLRAVDGLSLTVDVGETFGVVGPDGAGKTTTMRLLSAILSPDGGAAWVAGLNVVDESEAVKEKIGYMSQRFGLYADLTVMENLRFYADVFQLPRREMSEKLDRLLELSRLSPFRRRLAGNLSGGMKQKLALICSLVHSPKVLLLDEPTNGVDPLSRRDFWQMLRQLRKEGVTIFVSTSYLDEADRCRRVGLVHRGRLMAVGTPAELRGLMRETIIELHTDQPRDALAAIRRELPDTAAGMFGERLHLAAAEPERTISAARSALSAASVEIIDIRPIAPSLEDVFISMMAAEEQTAGAMQ